MMQVPKATLVETDAQLKIATHLETTRTVSYESILLISVALARLAMRHLAYEGRVINVRHVLEKTASYETSNHSSVAANPYQESTTNRRWRVCEGPPNEESARPNRSTPTELSSAAMKPDSETIKMTADVIRWKSRVV